METLEAAPAGTPKFVSDLDTLIRARYPLIYLLTWEEQRLDAILQDVARTHGKALLQWSVTRGLRRVSGVRTVTISEQSRDPVEALGAIGKLTEASLVVLKDFHPFLESPAVVRAMRELAQDLKSTYTTVILLAPVLSIPVELEKEVSVLDVPLPSFRDLFQLLKEIVTVVRRGNKARDELKGWLNGRTGAFSEPARKFGLPSPKGLLLLGVQGCGKSLTAKAIASVWSLPLLRLDLGRIFSSLIGSSEENLRRAIRVAESVSPTVLWIDEIEKGLAGNAGAAVTDSGVSARVFRALLPWLQEKTAPVFVVATANRIDAPPPELLRKGRFDEIFFLDLPRSAGRRSSFRLHHAPRGRPPAAPGRGAAPRGRDRGAVQRHALGNGPGDGPRRAAFLALPPVRGGQHAVRGTLRELPGAARRRGGAGLERKAVGGAAGAARAGACRATGKPDREGGAAAEPHARGGAGPGGRGARKGAAVVGGGRRGGGAAARRRAAPGTASDPAHADRRRRDGRGVLRRSWAAGVRSARAPEAAGGRVPGRASAPGAVLAQPAALPPLVVVRSVSLRLVRNESPVSGRARRIAL